MKLDELRTAAIEGALGSARNTPGLRMAILIELGRAHPKRLSLLELAYRIDGVDPASDNLRAAYQSALDTLETLSEVNIAAEPRPGWTLYTYGLATSP